MNPSPYVRRLPLALLLLLVLPCSRCLALDPSQIVLVVNKRSPQSLLLAQHYAAARHIPEGHTVMLDVPADDEIEYTRYETDVVPPIRAFLRKNNLDQSTLCLVTFYGVPFRIGNHSMTDAEHVEVAHLKDELAQTLVKIKPAVADVESLALSLDPNFIPNPGDNLNGLESREQAAVNCAGSLLMRETDPFQRSEGIKKLLDSLARLGGVAEVLKRFGEGQINNPASSDATRARWIKLRDNIALAHQQVLALQERRFDPRARSLMLRIALAQFGLIGYAQLLQAQIDYLDTAPESPESPSSGVTQSAFDNELALLWWGLYERREWLPNALNFRIAPHMHTPRVLMVMRLDGPHPDVVDRLIAAGIKTETRGLDGTIAIDSGAFPEHHDDIGKPDPFREFDRDLVHLFLLARTKGNLPATLDDKPEVFAPHSIKNVALYAGWYSLRRYVPGCDFVPGAVGYHIASLEMVGLHGDQETGWVHGLLNDGVVATVGAVAEPYLAAFPKPSDFFPLLMTGKLTLAEVYWRTTPMTSWMICAIGDPLYNPFAAKPAMKESDLPDDLKPALAPTEPGPVPTLPSPPTQPPTPAPPFSPPGNG